jgi:hypothetical protein
MNSRPLNLSPVGKKMSLNSGGAMSRTFKRILPLMPRYRAKELSSGEYVEGYYVEYHIPIFNDITHSYDKYEATAALFNDEFGERADCSYWHTIDINTLELIEPERNLFSNEDEV